MKTVTINYWLKCDDSKPGGGSGSGSGGSEGSDEDPK